MRGEDGPIRGCCAAPVPTLTTGVTWEQMGAAPRPLHWASQWQLKLDHAGDEPCPLQPHSSAPDTGSTPWCQHCSRAAKQRGPK